MNKYIKTPKGRFYYKPQTMFLGKKKIDKLKAKDNLLLFKKIADINNVPFVLFYGTLLGAVREHDFIAHDEDIDIVILEENKDAFLCLLFKLREYGFNLIRFDRRGSLYSIMRNGEYIDIYIYIIVRAGIRKCYEKELFPDKYFSEQTKIKFQNELFNVPKEYEECLEFYYGKNWKIPVVYANFNMSYVKRHIIQYSWFILNNVVPVWFYRFLMYVKNYKSGIEIYNMRVERIKKNNPYIQEIFEYK